MSSESTKPPWMRFEWYPTPPRLTNESLFSCPIAGPWMEESNKEVEELKESIHPYDKTELWDLAKRITNPYELISTFSSRLKLPKATCCLHPLSRSFFKMIEILHHFQFFERHKNPKLKSLHICEGPGGFIEAFHYLAETKNRLIQSSHAMTLRSTNIIIPGWRRATQFLQKHNNVNLLYGPNRTGDIYEPENQQACLEAVGQSGAHLVTADGGFDFSEDFINQEKNILRLLINSAIILLECVAFEGDVVLKLFDCNSSVTRDLIYILASNFVSWSLYKPVTSRPCNSEWYFCGKSAKRDRKVSILFLKSLRDMIAENPTIEYSSLLVINPLDDFLKKCQEYRCQKQIDALKEVLQFCKEKESINQEELWESHRNLTIQWCNLFRMPTEFKIR
jgi:23S rRNA U2552 (ribose-2'-O)-methylase RlmE/FtsJ